MAPFLFLVVAPFSFFGCGVFFLVVAPFLFFRLWRLFFFLVVAPFSFLKNFKSKVLQKSGLRF